MPNTRTGLKPRLRIDSAYYDRRAFYIPWNLSLEKFCDIKWLSLLDIGETASCLTDVMLQQRTSHGVRSYNVLTRARLDALRSHSGDPDDAAYTIAVSLADTNVLSSEVEMHDGGLSRTSLTLSTK